MALKRLIPHKPASGFPLCAIREIKFLKSLQHKNIVKLRDIVTSKGCEHLDIAQENKGNKSQPDPLGCGNLYLVFDYIEHDLAGLIDVKYKFPPRAIKIIAKQLFEALYYIHDKKIIHRDIKSSNVLITNRHQLKLADFGLARSTMANDGREFRTLFSNKVVTMWYKSPELLLGCQKYSYPVDIWSAGCVVAELELGRPIFPGKCELEELDIICRILGTPGEDTWSGIKQCPEYCSMLETAPKYTSTLSQCFTGRLTEPMLKFLERILVHDPNKRFTAKACIESSFFVTQPLPPNDPRELDQLHLSSDLHEFQTKLQRRENEAKAKLEGGLADADEATQANKASNSSLRQRDSASDDMSSMNIPDIELSEHAFKRSKP